MPNEIHRKIIVAEAALDFDTVLNSLPAGDIAWCNNIISLEDCDFAEFFMALVVGGTSPEGTLEFYVARAGANLRVADHHIDLSDRGVEGTAGDVSDIISDCGPPVFVVPANATASIVYQPSFRVWYPGGDFNLLVYNNTDEALASSGHSGYVRGWGPEVQ